MTEEFVTRTEFENFKTETRQKLEGYGNLLHDIDKKVDSIIAKLEVSSEADKNEKTLTKQIVDLEIGPVKEKVDKLEATKTWLLRLICTEFIAIIGLVLKSAGVF